jgi:hypothetical protein
LGDSGLLGRRRHLHRGRLGLLADRLVHKTKLLNRAGLKNKRTRVGHSDPTVQIVQHLR